jgi:hypothetical protein
MVKTINIDDIENFTIVDNNGFNYSFKNLKMVDGKLTFKFVLKKIKKNKKKKIKGGGNNENFDLINSDYTELEIL